MVRTRARALLPILAILLIELACLLVIWLWVGK